MSKNFVTPIGDEGMYILDTSSWRTVKPVMNKEICTDCGICMTICPVSSITGDDNKLYSINYDYCKGCGICAEECPSKAIEMIAEWGDK